MNRMQSCAFKSWKRWMRKGLKLNNTWSVIKYDSKDFNKKVHPHSFQMGDLVLALCRPIIITHKTKSKVTSKWDGPYVIQEVYTNIAYLIMAKDGLKIGSING
ncbi:hypothetical protein ACFX1Q_001060 [Malus domestica]